ncbi:hypothetical protein CERZMDRAFT_114818 [Cercospora zeae-maydis SCOH1-5]|uniref:Major facilitator superfamily (MFS) profile domain-containing protein n=1 Tax=Cercospora zeae-maydis SCOH1-5 TaxID=717836 RepID=A0A6A6F2Y8_9PEZI|nr:hypothetical protein CERZMDRAFT_114818 [Cercospora zeae-maydis SCOH1-5]
MGAIVHSARVTRLKTCSSTIFLLTSCCVATFSDVLGATVLPPILPFVLPDRANVPESEVQLWATVLPAITTSSIVLSTPFTGWLSDRCRRRKPVFISAVMVQCAGVACCFIGTHIALWIIGQIILGFGSAMVWSTTLALIVEAVPEAQLAKFLGFTSLSLTLGVFLGPVLGGVIYEHAGNYAVWSMVYGVFFVDLMLRIMLVEAKSKSEDAAADLEDRSGPQVKRTRFVAPTLLKSGRMLSALWAAFVQAAILGSFDATLTVRVKSLFGWSSQTAGLLYIAMTLPSFAGPLVGACADKFGGRSIAAAGFSLAPVVLVCLRFVDGNDVSDKVLLAALLFLLDCLLGTTISIFCAEAGHVVMELERNHPGICGSKGALAQAQGLWWAAYTLGLTIGLLWAGFVQQAAGWATMAWSLAVLCGATIVPVVLYTGGKLKVMGRDSSYGDKE